MDLQLRRYASHDKTRWPCSVIGLELRLTLMLVRQKFQPFVSRKNLKQDETGVHPRSIV